LGVVALGIMSKREPGFDPGNGDWDYGYWEAGPGLLRSPAQAAHCGGCHTGAADTDFVFVDKTWLGK
jgi:Cytochrome P460